MARSPMYIGILESLENDHEESQGLRASNGQNHSLNSALSANFMFFRADLFL